MAKTCCFGISFQVLPDLRVGTALGGDFEAEEHDLWLSGRMEDAFFLGPEPAPKGEAVEGKKSKRKKVAGKRAPEPTPTSSSRPWTKP